MEKISSILPSSPRIKAVDLSESGSVRPGAPSFGAPVGKAAINGGNAPTTAEKAVAAHNALMSRRSGDAHHPQLIRDMTDKFFMRNASEPGGVVNDVDLNFTMDIGSTAAPPEINPLDVPETTLAVQSAEPDMATSDPEWLIAESSVDDSDCVPPGSYLDVTV